jgi:hypothetical protein
LGYHSFTAVLTEAFHPTLLRKPELSQDYDSPLRVLFRKAVKAGDVSMGVVNALIAVCAPVWFDLSTDPTIALLYLDEISLLVTFGPVRKGDNADLDLSEDLAISVLDEESFYGPLPDVPTQDSFGRALLVSYFHKYLTVNKSEKAEELVGQVIIALLEVNFGQEYAKKIRLHDQQHWPSQAN